MTPGGPGPQDPVPARPAAPMGGAGVRTVALVVLSQVCQFLTISALARLHSLRPDSVLERSLERAVRFAGELVHPDGSYGGEYGSRNTLAFFPDGFELVGRWMPEASGISATSLAIAMGSSPCSSMHRCSRIAADLQAGSATSACSTARIVRFRTYWSAATNRCK